MTLPPKQEGKPYTYQRRIVLPVLVIMVATLIVGFALHIAATVSDSWARTNETVKINWGFSETCTTLTRQEQQPTDPITGLPGPTIDVEDKQCHKIGEGDCAFYNDFYFGEAGTCGGGLDDQGNPKPAPAEMVAAASDLKTAKALSIVSTFFSITPLPFVFLAFFKELKWGMYSMPLYALWFIFWVSTISIFNKSCSFVINYEPPYGGKMPFPAGTGSASLYDAGAFLHVGAFVAIAVSCIAFWASYLACFQVDVYDADGNLVPIEELMAKRQANAAPGNTVSTQDLVTKA